MRCLSQTDYHRLQHKHMRLPEILGRMTTPVIAAVVPGAS